MASPTVTLPKFRRVKIGQADFNPFIGLGGPTNTQTVAVSDIPNSSGERLSWSRGKASFARIRMDSRSRQKRKGYRGKHDPQHQPKLTVVGLGFVCIAKSRRIGQR